VRKENELPRNAAETENNPDNQSQKTDIYALGILLSEIFMV